MERLVNLEELYPGQIDSITVVVIEQGATKGSQLEPRRYEMNVPLALKCCNGHESASLLSILSSIIRKRIEQCEEMTHCDVMDEFGGTCGRFFEVVVSVKYKTDAINCRQERHIGHE